MVLAETEDVWTALFRQQGARYVEPTLVLYTDTVTSACGTAASSAGPFYCPGDQKVYLDLSFYNDLQTQFQAPGDMAMAYVIAHEVGHHVQYQMGTLQEVQSLREGSAKPSITSTACGWNCRPITMPGCGPIMRSEPIYWSQGILRRL